MERVANGQYVEQCLGGGQGGQAQRVTLAICVALKPAFLLLDEPTSALDHESALAAERVLTGCGAGLLWVTHEDAQPLRVGGRILQLPLGTQVAPPTDYCSQASCTLHRTGVSNGRHHIYPVDQASSYMLPYTAWHHHLMLQATWPKDNSQGVFWMHCIEGCSMRTTVMMLKEGIQGSWCRKCAVK